MISNLNLVITYNKLFQNITFLSASLLKNPNIIVHLNYIDSDTKNSKGFLSESWYYCLEQKIIFADFIFSSLKNNQVLAVADSDIYYLDSDKIYDLQKYMQDNDLDFMSGSEDDHSKYNKHKSKANCGFFLIRKNSNTLNFFQKILSYQIQSFKYAEQDIINLYLLKHLKYEILNPLYFAMGCYMYCSIKANPEQITMLHCTCADTLQQKIIQMDNLVNYYGLKKNRFFKNEITKKEKIFYIQGKQVYNFLEDKNAMESN